MVEPQPNPAPRARARKMILPSAIVGCLGAAAVQLLFFLIGWLLGLGGLVHVLYVLPAALFAWAFGILPETGGVGYGKLGWLDGMVDSIPYVFVFYCAVGGLVTGFLAYDKRRIDMQR